MTGDAYVPPMLPMLDNLSGGVGVGWGVREAKKSESKRVLWPRCCVSPSYYMCSSGRKTPAASASTLQLMFYSLIINIIISVTYVIFMAVVTGTNITSIVGVITIS